MSRAIMADPRRALSPHEGPRASSVFINCPYDAEYRPVFDAIVFTLLCYGMWPRWADDSTRSLTRLDRIVDALRASRFSIHDLSRCKGEGDENLARMNMPLELGMALEQAYPAKDAVRDHRCIVLVPAMSSYRQVVSDLNAFDLLPYDGTPEAMVSELGSFLKVSAGRVQAPTVLAIQRALKDWNKLVALQRKENGGKDPTWTEIVGRWDALVSKRQLVAGSGNTGPA